MYITMIKYFWSALLIPLLVLSGCNHQSQKQDKPVVSVSIVPQKFIIDHIAGSWLNVNVLIPPGASPVTYEPTPQQLKNLAHSALYYQIGHIGFELAWIDKLKSVSPQTKFIDTSKGLKLLFETDWDEGHVGESHEDGGDNYNPHIWLSPDLVKAQAKVIYETLVKQFPEHELTMKSNFEKFSYQCDSVRSKLDSIFKPLSGTSFIVYHPVWNYLAHDYNLHQVAIEFNGKEASANKLKNIIDFANEKNIKVIFVQKEFSDAQAQAIAQQIGGRVVELNPLDYNWFEVMESFVEAFEKGL